MLHRISLVVVAVVLGWASSAPALITEYRTFLDGPSENPPAPSLGTGTATVLYDDALHTLFIDVQFSGLTGNTTVAHIHAPAIPPANAGVATQVPTFVGFPAGVTAGTYTNTFDLTQAASFNPAFMNNNGGTPAGAEAALVLALNQGRAYLNIHTDFRPGGEIRGFFAATPEPATAGLGLLSLVAVAGAALRRRRGA